MHRPATTLKALSSSARQFHQTVAFSISHSRLTSLGKNNESLVDVERIKRWSEKNEDFARKVIEVPKSCCWSFSSSNHHPTTTTTTNTTTSATASDDLDSDSDSDLDLALVEYLKWRKWDFEPKSNKEEEDTNEKESDVKMALALLSHTLTFPLTLGRNIDLFQPSSTKHNKIRLCCIGPRAETNLPLDMWKEFLIMANSSKSDIDTINAECLEWIIDFIGPDVPNKMQSRHVSLRCSDSNDNNTIIDTTAIGNNISLTMNYHNGLFHQHLINMYRAIKQKVENKNDLNSNEDELTSKILNLWDGFILFNPGIGHENLKQGWTPTLKFIIKSNKPIMSTAHSEIDARRDLEVWKAILEEEDESQLQHENKSNKLLDEHLFEYVQNPFASRMCYKDPFPPKNLAMDTIHYVNPNHSILRIER